MENAEEVGRVRGEGERNRLQGELGARDFSPCKIGFGIPAVIL